jgi:hypothetical protein
MFLVLMLLGCGDKMVATWDGVTITDNGETFDLPMSIEEETFGIVVEVSMQLVVEKGLEGSLETTSTVSAFGFSESETDSTPLTIEKLGGGEYRITSDELDDGEEDTDDTDLDGPSAPDDAICVVSGDELTCATSGDDEWSASFVKVAKKDL